MPPLFVAVLPKKMSEDAFYALGEGAGGRLWRGWNWVIARVVRKV